MEQGVPGAKGQVTATAAATDQTSELTRSSDISYLQLLVRRFLKNRLAVLGLVVLGIIYVSSLGAGFVAPYDPQTRFLDSITVPPEVPRFADVDGRVHIRPFVYKMKVDRDPRTLQRVYNLDTTVMYPVRFLVIGEEYRFLFWTLNRHLFGVEGSRIHLLGTDTQSRDLFSRVVHGGRISTSVGLIGVSISLMLGVCVGMASGLLGGSVDAIIQRVIEVVLSFPTVPLWLALSASFPKYWSSLRIFFFITIILSLLGWAGLARVVRGMTLSLRHEEFVLSARMSGGGPWWIIRRHLLPANLSYVIVSATLAVPGMILGETALSFLGLGIRPPIVSWGVLLKDAQQLSVMAVYPWIITPVLFLAVTVLAFNFVGDGLRDAVDPHSRY